MSFRRVFIIRKDLNLSAGKLAAMVAHCAEGYWTRMIQRTAIGFVNDFTTAMLPVDANYYKAFLKLDKEEFEQYLQGSFVKTICEAKNKTHLLKAKTIAESLGLTENIDFGIINDNCLTELIPENEDGTTTVGIWFKPLPDEIAHQISKKYQLYKR